MAAKQTGRRRRCLTQPKTSQPRCSPAASPSSPARPAASALPPPRLAGRGLKLVIADREGAPLYQAIRDVAAMAAGGEDEVLGFACDVSRPDDVEKLADAAYDKFGEVSVLMNNAGIGANPGKPWENRDGWKALIDVNFWGVVHGVRPWPRMIGAGPARHDRQHRLQARHHHPARQPRLQRLQGRAEDLTEGLAHELRNTQGASLCAHLLIPGFTFTGMTAARDEKPPAPGPRSRSSTSCSRPGARRLLHPLPRQRATRATDERRMAWAIGDIIENRPALSRWHPDYKDAFASIPRRARFNAGPK